ncbi:MAG: glycosyltransferase family 25 protein [Pseudomonadota bacterium]|nr:glycosyltransferase family 25 protein [Pseudomonadota bacterium]
MQVYVINLERNPERLEFIGQRLESINIDFNRIDAVDGYALDKKYIEEFRETSKRPTGWKEGQIGCFLSHRKVWQVIVDGEAEYGVILEDDLHISSALKGIISNLNWIPKDADVIRLESTTNWVKLTKLGHVNNRDICLVNNDTWGAGAYVLSKKTARFLLEQDPAIWLPADTYIFAKSLSDTARALKIYQLNPVLVCQDKYAEGVVDSNQIRLFDSEIEVGHSGVSSIFDFKKTLKIFVAPLLGYTKTQFKD